MNGGHLLVKCLLEQAADTVFGVPGESYLAALDGMAEAGEAFRFVSTRNEGGAAFMAEAWGKLTGRPGVCFVTRGPGATNASIGVHTAAQSSTPMLLLVGQVPTYHRGKEAFQEIDYEAFFGPIAKLVIEVDSADEIPDAVERAYAVALSGRPGPVVISLPEDTLADYTDARPHDRVEITEQAPDPSDIEWAAEVLGKSARPLVLVGGGGWNHQGRADLRALAESTGLPIAVVFRFNDLIDNHSTHYVGEAGVGMPVAVKESILTADVILAVGIRFGEMTTAGYTLFADPDQMIIHAHPGKEELGKIVTPSLEMVAGPNATVAALAACSIGTTPERESWVAARRQAFLEGLDYPTQPGELDMPTVMAWLRANLPPNSILTNGAGNFSVWNNKSFLYGSEARLLGPQNGAMGYGLPAAIAAKVRHPDRTVVAFCGDGDLQMTIEELGTAVQEHAAPVVLVFNNRMYGTIRMHQERTYPHRVSGTDLVNPDFAALAQAYGMHGESVRRTEDFGPAFERAVESDTGGLIELVVPHEMLTPTQSIDQARGTA